MALVSVSAAHTQGDELGVRSLDSFNHLNAPRLRDLQLLLPLYEAPAKRDLRFF